MKRNKREILKTLGTKRKTMQEMGVKSIALFGSTARGENTNRSDLDFVVELKQKSFDVYMALKEFLETLFGCNVDLVLKNTIKPRLKQIILREAVHAPGL